MAEDAYIFSRSDMVRIDEAVRRAKRQPRNNVQQWRERKICRQGTKEILWALTPPGEEMLVTFPIADCMIANNPNSGEYGDEEFSYAEVGGFSTYCAGLFPESWYPIHASSKYVICAGAWSVRAEAITGCDRDDYFDAKVGTEPNDVTINDVHSPFGDIEAGSNVWVAWKGGEGEYMAVLDECT